MHNKVEIANREPVSTVTGKKTGREFQVTDYMYGCLGPSENNPLSAVSITGNSISIDIWTDCQLQCAYCHVQGVKQDLDCNGKMRRKPIRRTNYSLNEILEELIDHPLFEKNTGPISICTSSTEPFFSEDVIESTMEIMEWFQSRRLKNPFWIVTKAGIPEECINRLKKISKTNKLIISICWANNKKNIEPFLNNRFLNIEKLKECKNISFNWYLRPLVREWNNDFGYLENMFKEISDKYGTQIDSIIPGGLRWTEGIEYGMTEVRGLNLPQNVSAASRHNKTLTDDDFKNICFLADKYFPRVPVYKHSSCAISHALKVNNISLTNYLKAKDCELSLCPIEQRMLCVNKSFISIEQVNEILNSRGIEIEIKQINLKNPKLLIEANPKFETFSPSIKQQIITIIARLMTLKKTEKTPCQKES